jgi:hypothetical protein
VRLALALCDLVLIEVPTMGADGAIGPADGLKGFASRVVVGKGGVLKAEANPGLDSRHPTRLTRHCRHGQRKCRSGLPSEIEFSFIDRDLAEAPRLPCQVPA